MNRKGENANGAISKYENPLFNVSKTAAIIAPINIPETNKVFFFFYVRNFRHPVEFDAKQWRNFVGDDHSRVHLRFVGVG